MDGVYKCIAWPCLKEREKGSGFCPKHKKEHTKVKWKVPRSKS